MKKIIFPHRYYIIAFLFITVFVAYFLLNYGKVQIHLYINRFVGVDVIDTFFHYITFLGDGVFGIILCIILLCIDIKKGLFLILAFLLSALMVFLLKQFAFYYIWRPCFVFEWFVGLKLTLVEGEKLLFAQSFPSGHATTAFVLFMYLFFIIKNKIVNLGFFILPFIIAFSRTYLSHHWLVDIYFGSIIGFSFAFIFYILYCKFQLPQLEGSIFKLLKK